jgi:hypothetical protein
MASMTNLARAATIAALLLFFLPWITVSCSPSAMSQMAGAGAPSAPMGAGDMTLVTATGVQLAAGTATVSNPGGGAPQAANNGANNPFARPNLAVLSAAVLILLSFAATFLLKGRTGALAGAAGCALAAVAICYAILVQIPAEVRGSFATSNPGGGAGAPPINPAELAQLIQVKAQLGFWLTVAALVAAIVLHMLAMNRPVAAVSPAPPPA